MKVACTILSVTVLFALCGCNQSTTGGPGTTLPESEKPMVGETDNTFTLSAPVMATNVKRGESDTFSISIDRADNFTQDVTVSFDNVPAGVTIAPSTAVLHNTVEEIEFRVSAAATAVEGDSVVGITGQPASGPAADAEMTITVEKADGE